MIRKCFDICTVIFVSCRATLRSAVSRLRAKMAYYCVNIEEQLHSILDALTKDAVTEIVKLIEDGSAVLRLEIFRSHKENETLRMKLQEMERDLKAAREDIKKRDDLKDSLGRRYSLPTVEEDSWQLDMAGQVKHDQNGEVLSQVLVKKEGLDDAEDQNSDWRSNIFEAEESTGAESVPGLKQDGVPAAEAGLQPGLVTDSGQFGWLEPEVQDGYADADANKSCNANANAEDAGSGPSRTELPVLEGEGLGAELYKEEVWPGEAGSELGPYHQDWQREESDSRVKGGRPFSPHGFTAAAERPFDRSQSRKTYPSHVSPRGQQQSPIQGRPFRCPHCARSFPDQPLLAMHQRSHRRDRQFRCSTCGKGFFRKHHLSSHQRTHTGERPYCCKYCGKDYKQLSNLINHRRSHTGERPYSCAACGKSFHRLDNLKAHQRVHNRARKFVCSFAGCQESFGQQYQFESHQLSHAI
ncbi:hypothetical protein GJAV_G00000990 [Gymnothorax javanicus]|nr:hypothetical protein GJAV_G00000990 [Gymnothorax javanicus]